MKVQEIKSEKLIYQLTLRIKMLALRIKKLALRMKK